MNPSEASQHYQTKRAEVETLFNTIGTSRENFSKQIREAVELASKFSADLAAKTAGQAVHDQITNLPCGIYHRSQYSPRKAFLSALAGACGRAVGFGTDDALELAADILEDVNAHAECAQVRAMMGKAG